MKRFLILFLFIGLPCYANIPENIINLDNETYTYCINQECNIKFENFYTQLQNNIDKLKETDDWEMEEVEPYVYKMLPEPKILYYSYNNWTGISIDHKYMYKRYHKYLNKEWKSYLNIYKDNKYLEWTYGKKLSEKEKLKIINNCNKHLRRYPNFKFNDNIRNTIKDLFTYIDVERFRKMYP